MMFAAATLSSCGLYQKYERPAVNAEGLVRDVVSDVDTLAVSDTACFGDLEWRKVFTDPQLQSLIDVALENNTDLLNASLNIDMAKAQLTSARLAFLPQFAFSPSGTLSKVLAKDQEWYKTYSLPVDASWSVDAFGKLRAANRAAKVSLLQSQYYQQAVRSGVICGIANCYYSLLMMDAQLQILDEMTKLTKDNWEMMKLQKSLGGARETSVGAAEASYLSVQASAIDMKRQIRETENTLSLLLGQSAHQIQRGKLDAQVLPTEFSTGLNIHMLNNRPDVMAKEMALASCFYGVEQARANFYPSITISAEGAFTNSLGSVIVNPGKFMAAFVASLTQPIFAQGKLIAGLKVAKAQYQQAYNNWQYNILSAGAEVSDALVQYNSSKDKAVVDKQQVEVLTKNVSYTRDLFKMGSSTYLEVIGAQQSLLNAEISLVTDNFNKMQAVVNLYSALGGGRK